MTGAEVAARSGRHVAARIGPVGLWSTIFHWHTAARAREMLAKVEELGFGAVWVGEAKGKPSVTLASLLLCGSERIVVATGIASIWARDPVTMANDARTLADAAPGRFVLGLGVSHPFLTEPRGREYRAPLEHMRWYLQAMDEAPWYGPEVEPPPRVLAGLGPKMLELARDRAAGAHPYFVPVEHTQVARRILGPEPLLAPEQAAVFETDPARAREVARRYMAGYLKLKNYTTNLRRLGWADEDLAGGGSDRLVDALVAWGDRDRVAARVKEHLQAGADHVAVRILTSDPKDFPERELHELAEAMGL